MSDQSTTSSTRLARRVRRNIDHLLNRSHHPKSVIGTWIWTYDPPDKIIIKGDQVIGGLEDWLTHEITDNGLPTDQVIENHHLRHKDIDICLSGHPTPDGGMIGSVSVFKLSRSDHGHPPNWQKMMNDWPVPAMAVNGDGELMSANKQFYTEFFADNPGKVHRGMSIQQIFPHAELNPVDMRISGGQYNLLSLSDGDGRIIVFSRQYQSTDGNGMGDEKIPRLAGLGHEFYDRLGHELRTPLNAIIGFSQVMEDMVNGDAQLIEFIGDIHDSGQRLNRLLNDMVTWLKIDRHEIEFKAQSVQLVKALMTSLRKHRNSIDNKNIQIKWKSDGQSVDDPAQLSWNVPGDETMFQQLIDKLIHLIYASAVDDASLTIHIYEQGGFVHLSAEWPRNENQVVWNDLRLAIMDEILDQNGGTLIDEMAGDPSRLVIRFLQE